MNNWLGTKIQEVLASEHPYGYGELRKDTKEAGAYVIYIPASQHVYCGSTNHLWRRRIKHIADLRNGVHENTNLQHAFSASGDNRIVFVYFKTTNDIDPIDKEQEFITALWGHPLLCNTGPDARFPTKGIKYGAERIAKMSEVTKQRFVDHPEAKDILSTLAKEQWTEPVSRAIMIEKALPNLKLGIEATSKAVKIEGRIYPSLSSASRAYGLVPTSVAYRIKSKHWPTWAMYQENKPREGALEEVRMDNIKQGLIIYTDGGCRPNPGRAGWGIHGYLFAEALPKKGSGNANWMITNHGYVPKSGMLTSFLHGIEGEDEEQAPAPIVERIDVSQEKEITPIHYVDGFGSFLHDTTNNVAELCAATMALQYAKDWDIQSVDIYTDSRYTRDGLTNWADQWKRNNFIKKDGQPVTNISYWKDLIAARDELEAKGIKVTMHWIESHEGHAGNEDADQLATIGVLHARANKTITEIKTSAAEGYWKYDHNRHPFLNHPRLYFNTQSAFNKPGEYYIGNHGKEDDMLGKRISDGCYAAVFLKEPEAVVESVRNRQIEIGQEIHSLVMIRMDQLYKANTHRQISQYGALATDWTSSYRADMNTVDKQPLTREFKPALIAWRAVESITFLIGQLDRFQKNSPEIVATDLTAILYEAVSKPPKKKGDAPTTTMSLKSEFDVGYAALGVEANYMADGGEVKQATIILSLGIDVLDRNALKRLETRNPVVTLITWPDSATSFRYATVVESNGDVGIWAGVYSNLRIVT